jgi:hypothetical protein
MVSRIHRAGTCLEVCDALLCTSQPYGIAQVLNFIDIFITVQNKKRWQWDSGFIDLVITILAIHWMEISLAIPNDVCQASRPDLGYPEGSDIKEHFSSGPFSLIWCLLLASLDLRPFLQRTRLGAIVQLRTHSLQHFSRQILSQGHGTPNVISLHSIIW